MDRTRKAFITAQKNGLIKMVNRQIKSVDIEGYGGSLWIVINLYPHDGYNKDQIKLSVPDMERFMHIFNYDNVIDVESTWNSQFLIDNYIRLCYYLTPEEEMHELADEEEFVGVKHIINDDPECYSTYIEKMNI